MIRTRPFSHLGLWCVCVAGLLALASYVTFVTTSNPSNSRGSITPAVAAPFRAAGAGLTPPDAVGKPSATARVVESYGRLPLAFEANSGQTDSQVKFISRGQGYTMFLTGNEAVLALRAGNQRARGKGQKTEVEAHAPTLLKSPSAFFMGVTHNQQPKTNTVPFDNLQLSIIDSPAPRPQNLALSTLRLRLVNANPDARVVGLDELPGKSNYFIGNDPKKWRTRLPQYAKVKYQGVYPGIDLVYYGNQGKLEHDFVVSPGANPGAIKLAIEGAEGISVDEGGNLVARLNGGNVVLNKPTAYQKTSVNPKSKIENPKSVDGRFVLLASNQIGFEVANYNKELPLIIDPVLSYATYLGGSPGAGFISGEDDGYGIAVDSSGNAYVAGSTASTNFPTVNPLYPGQVDSIHGYSDAFVAKLSADGSALVYSTYLGGYNNDAAYGIAVDSSGNAYVTGMTMSDASYVSGFPTVNALYPNNHGGTDAFVAKLNFDGSALIYSTYLGGDDEDVGNGIAADSLGNAYVTGVTQSDNFPTANPVQPTCGGCRLVTDAFVTKINATGSALVYSTYLGGSNHDYGFGIAVDSFGNAYIGGYTDSSDFPTHNPLQATLAGGTDGFVLKLNPAGSALVFSTFLGGGGAEYLESLAIDSQHNIYVTGATYSTDFPTVNATLQNNENAGGADAFVTKISSSGSSLLFSAYLGGTGDDIGLGIAVDSSGNFSVAGETTSTDFPTVSPIQPANGGGISDAFISRFSPTGPLPVFSTYLGGSGQEDSYGGSMAVDSVGNVYVTGETSSPDFPTTNALQSTFGGGTDAYVAKISFPTAAGVSLIPASLNFGDQTTGTSSNAKLVTLANSGTLPLTISSITMSSGTDYAQTDDCPISPTTLAGGAHCTVSVTFKPTTTGTLHDDVVITSDAPGSPNMIDLTGNGVPPAPAVGLSSTSLPFADQLVNSTSSPQSVTLANTGSAPLTITSIAKSGDFAQSNNCPLAPSTLAANISCMITVTFGPTTRGNLTGSVTITDDAAGSPHIVSLSGRGVIAAGVQLSATTLDFGNQLMGSTIPAQTVMLTNSGDQDLTISSIAAAGDFSRTTTCPISPSTLAGGANCTMTITFAPTATGVRDSTMTITDNAAGSPHTVTLKGTGTDFTLGTQSGGSTSATVNAGGTATYNLQIAPTGFSGNVTLSCAFQGSTPRGASCSVPSPVAVNGVDPAPFAVSVTTTARSLAGPRGPAQPPAPSPWAKHTIPLFIGLMMLMLAAIGALYDRRQPVRTPALQWAPLATTMLFVLLWAACGGGRVQQTQQTQTGTLAGTYNLTLTARASGVSKTSTLTLRVN